MNEKTIEFDCKTNYHIDELKTIDSKIEKVNAEISRGNIPSIITYYITIFN